MDDRQFALTKHTLSGWSLFDDPHVSFVRTVPDNAWAVEAFGKSHSKLHKVGILNYQSTDMTLKMLAQVVADTLGCSPQLRQRGVQYSIGTTGLFIHRQGTDTWVYFNTKRASSPLYRRLNGYMDEHYTDTHFTTRASLHTALIEAYCAANASALTRLRRHIVQRSPSR